MEDTVLADKSCPRHVSDRLAYFIQDWRTINFQNRASYGGAAIPDLSRYPQPTEFPDLVFFKDSEEDIFAKATRESSQLRLDERLLTDYNMEVKALDDKDRHVHRLPLLSLLPPREGELQPSDTRILYPPPTTSLYV